jgi:hypothetical protein
MALCDCTPGELKNGPGSIINHLYRDGLSHVVLVLSPTRKFNWFVENEFYLWKSVVSTRGAGWMFIFIFLCY